MTPAVFASITADNIPNTYVAGCSENTNEEDTEEDNWENNEEDNEEDNEEECEHLEVEDDEASSDLVTTPMGTLHLKTAEHYLNGGKLLSPRNHEKLGFFVNCFSEK